MAFFLLRPVTFRAAFQSASRELSQALSGEWVSLGRNNQHSFCTVSLLGKETHEMCLLVEDNSPKEVCALVSLNLSCFFGSS